MSDARKRARVLVVDEEDSNRRLLVAMLESDGHAAIEAPDGPRALELVRRSPPDLILLRVMKPDMDGYALARSIRALEATRGGDRTPVIACTANALAGEAEKCLAAGMDDCLAAPIELSRLQEMLGRWLPIPAAGATCLTGPDTVAPPSGAPLDRSRIAATWGADESTVRTILTEFRSANEVDAAMLRRALQKGDMAQVTHAAHRMVGAGTMVGALEFAGICNRIHRAARLDERVEVQKEMPAFEAEWTRLNDCIDGLLQPAS